jgi:hypothetical protein
MSEVIIAMPPVDRRDTTPTHTLPIWLAALLARGCRAIEGSVARPVDWRWVANRAMYTNDRADVEVIEPFGIPLRCGETIAVTWLSGETAYTIELLRAAA